MPLSSNEPASCQLAPCMAMHGFTLVYIYLYIYIYIYMLTCWFVAVLIRERFRASCLRRASKLLRPSPRPLPRAVLKHGGLEAAIWRLPGLWEQRFRGSRSSGAAVSRLYRALGAAMSRLQMRLRHKWLRPRFSRHFASVLEPGDILGSPPGGSGRLEEASGGFELAQEGFPVASSGLESALKWPRGE